MESGRDQGPLLCPFAGFRRAGSSSSHATDRTHSLSVNRFVVLLLAISLPSTPSQHYPYHLGGSRNRDEFDRRKHKIAIMAKASSLVPLIILFVVIGVIGFVGYQIFLWTGELTTKGKDKMEKKNISFKDGGLHVGVKDRSAEHAADKTQR